MQLTTIRYIHYLELKTVQQKEVLDSAQGSNKAVLVNTILYRRNNDRQTQKTTDEGIIRWWLFLPT